MHSAVGIPLLPAQAVAEGQGGGGCQQASSIPRSICTQGVCSAHRKVLLVGELDNLGDALLAQVEAEQLVRTDMLCDMIIAPYARPPADMGAHFAARGTRVLPIRERQVAFLRLCIGAELFIGGGHAIRQTVSVGWLLLVLLGCWMARLSGGNISVVGAGVTPVIALHKRMLWHLILNRCSAINLRDADSAQVLLKWIPRLVHKVRITNDIAFTESFDAAPVRVGPHSVCVVAPAAEPLDGRLADTDRLVKLISMLHQRGVIGEVRFLAHDIRPAMDTGLCQALAKRVSSELNLPTTLVGGPLTARLVNAYRDADLVITGRLHGLIIASMLHRPVICFGDPRGKLRPFAKRFGFPSADVDNEDVDAQAERLTRFLHAFDHRVNQPILECLRAEAAQNFA